MGSHWEMLQQQQDVWAEAYRSHMVERMSLNIAEAIDSMILEDIMKKIKKVDLKKLTKKELLKALNRVSKEAATLRCENHDLKLDVKDLKISLTHARKHLDEAEAAIPEIPILFERQRRATSLADKIKNFARNSQVQGVRIGNLTVALRQHMALIHPVAKADEILNYILKGELPLKEA